MPSYQRKVQIPGKSGQEIYEKVSKSIDRLFEKYPQWKFDVARDAASRRMSADAKMFSAELQCEDGAVQIHVKLGLLATPFRGKIDEGIDKWLAKHFPPA
ncbi:MAG: polyhydroxyalkanoic acid system family protein [Bacteriovoracia bacterium]